MSEIKVKYPIGGFAPGNYSNKCATCGSEFVGDKYARQCEPCAINTVNESNNKARKELHQLKTALQNIELNYETINKALKQANEPNTSQEQNALLADVSNNEVAVCRCKTNNISIVFNGVAYCEDCELPKAN